MSTQKGPKMTLKMSTGRNKIPLCFIMRVPHYTYKREQVLENTGPTITVQANVMMNPQGTLYV